MTKQDILTAIQNSDFSKEDLLAINRAVNSELTMHKAAEIGFLRHTLGSGDSVRVSSERHPEYNSIVGEVVKVNRVRTKIKITESKHWKYNVGTILTVPMDMLIKA